MEMMSKIGDSRPNTFTLLMACLEWVQCHQTKEQMQANLAKYRIIMDSMTQHEKDEPLVLKSQRIRRIARGSGTTEKDVKEPQSMESKPENDAWNEGRQAYERQMQSMMDVDDLDLEMG